MYVCSISTYLGIKSFNEKKPMILRCSIINNFLLLILVREYHEMICYANSFPSLTRDRNVIDVT